MTSDSPFVPKGKPRPFAGQTCGYKPQAERPECGKKGAWHILWDRYPGDNSVTCDEHMEIVQQRWVYDARHRIYSDCTMPGALWDHKANLCAVPDDKQTSNQLSEHVPSWWLNEANTYPSELKG